MQVDPPRTGTDNPGPILNLFNFYKLENRKNRHWTEAEKIFLTAQYNLKTIPELSKLMNRTEWGIRWMASKLSLTNKPLYWHVEETKWLAENWLSKSVEELADHLKRTPKSVTHKIHQLRIAKTLKGNIDTSPIQKGVPFYNGKAGEFRSLLQAMKQGDSFEYPTEERQTLANQIQYFADRFYRTKQIDANTRRVWRLL